MKEISLWMNTIDRLDVLIPKCARTLNLFYHPTHGFQSKPGDGGTSIISHAVSIEAYHRLRATRGFSYATEPEKMKQWVVFATHAWTTGSMKKPTSYPVSLAVPSLSLLRGVATTESERNAVISKIAEAVNLMRDAVSRLAQAGYAAPELAGEPILHAMFWYRMRRALASIEKDWVEDLVAYKDTALTAQQYRDQELNPIAKMLDSYMESKLYYFLSLCAAIENNDDDALQLGYLIYTLHKFSSFDNDVVIDHAINLVLRTICRDKRLAPPVTVLRDEEKKLNITASPMEVLTLLSELRQVRRRFSQHWEKYEAVCEWLFATERQALRQGEQCPVWMAEPYRGVGQPEAWLNAAVIRFLSAYRELLAEVTGDQLMVEFGAVVSQPRFTWEEILDSHEFKEELAEGFIKPVMQPAHPNSPMSKVSIILFGPPGTAKSSIAKAIAWELRWPYIELLPHNFAEEGIDGVIRRVREVFRQLLVMKNCLVFFDEIDELVRGREEEYQKMGRFITTSVLPWFQALHDKGEVLFVVATNNIRNFDPAVKRPGRFDYVIPVGPPDQSDCLRVLTTFLQQEGIKDENKARRVAETIGKKLFAVDIPIMPTVQEGNVRKHAAKPAPTMVKWHVTIGELRYLAEHVVRKSKTGRLDMKTLEKVSDEFVQRASRNPMISGSDWVQFIEDANQYRYPPFQEGVGWKR